MDKKRILVVDDEATNIDILMELLGADYDLAVALNGGEALEQTRETQPDLILLDILMPGLSGLEVCRLLKTDPKTKNIPIIFITIKDAIADELEGFRLGAADYIRKPFHPPVVRARVATQLALSDQRHALEQMVRQRTEELSHALDEAKKAAQAKDSFLANMSHELRNPLAGIIGMTNVLMERSKDEEYLSYLDLTKQAAHRLLGILERMLELSNLRGRYQPFRRSPFRIRPEISRYMDSVKERAEEKGLFFTWTMDESIPEIVNGSPRRLASLLDQLVDNALHFTREGGIAVKVERSQDCLVPRMSLDKNEFVLLISVKDTGVGIPDEKQDYIFESFNVGESHLTKELAGSGLGLALAKELVEKMGGRIWVRSTAGKGSVFNVAIPLQSVEEDAER